MASERGKRLVGVATDAVNGFVCDLAQRSITSGFASAGDRMNGAKVAKIKRLKRFGFSIQAIANEMGLSIGIVRRNLQRKDQTEKQKRQRRINRAKLILRNLNH